GEGGTSPIHSCWGSGPGTSFTAEDARCGGRPVEEGAAGWGEIGELGNADQAEERGSGGSLR
ncbi:MAG TPA: hypothetical protein VLE53_04670, partial [Gemmatimonadaceae bacterium]|nr:hypothetical protein [Gemmatimonadaceae bacterium]